jgi:hypothetical protein
MSPGWHFLEQYRKRLSIARDERFICTHESFLQELADREDDPTDGLSTDARDNYVAFFSECQRRYLAIKEKEANENMIALVNGATVSAVNNISKGFGRRARLASGACHWRAFELVSVARNCSEAWAKVTVRSSSSLRAVARLLRPTPSRITRMLAPNPKGRLEFFSLLACKVGSLAMLLAMRLASSSVSTFQVGASFGFSRE